ncbi:hypothetical protein FC789_12935 [Clostridium botulinum]|nr:hypothetical protein [Clostridium botulinum]
MEHNFDIPKSLVESYSAKAITLTVLEDIKELLKNEYNADKQVILLTSYGFIKCDIDIDEPSDELLMPTDKKDQYSLNIKTITQFRNSFINSIESENPNIKLRDNGALLYLKNVTIYSNGISASPVNPSATFDSFVIFADQILGFSLTSRTAD